MLLVSATISNEISSCRKDEISFDKVECCFDIVAKHGNNVEATFDLVERTNLYDKLVRHCCRCGNNVE